jgi:hypothetical protein
LLVFIFFYNLKNKFGAMFFQSILWCSQSDDNSQEDLARFG